MGSDESNWEGDTKGRRALGKSSCDGCRTCMDARARNNDTTDGNRGGPTPPPVPLSPPWEEAVEAEAEALSTAFLAKFSSSRTCFAPVTQR